MEFGQKVKYRRIAQNFTQGELAKRTGIKQPTLSSIESGRRNPSLTIAARLASALGCTLDELVAETEEGAK